MPTFTLGKGDSIHEWAFWNQDLPLDSLTETVQGGGPLPEAHRLELPIEREDLEGMDAKGVGWLAVRIHVPDSLVGRPYYVSVGQYGACEIFVDSLRIGRIGRPGPKGEEKRRYTRLFSQYQHVFRKSGVHHLFCRFTDRTWEVEKERYAHRSYGLEGLVLSEVRADISIWGFLRVMIGFGIFEGALIALGLIHLLIFLFYPRKRGNLYYVAFIWVMAVLLSYSITGVSEDPVHRLQKVLYFTYLGHLFTFALLTLLYVFLKNERFGVIYWTLLLGGACFIGACELEWIGDRSTSLLLIPLIGVECLRVIGQSLLQKKRGSWILGIGAGLFVIFPLLIVLFGAVFEVNVHLTGIGGLLIGITWTVLIPLSMSIYLAYDFATTSQELQKKLEEVEELNERNMEQEREKQRILEEKKEELEEKVKERTAELEERKEEIEDAHREITDSINYAQRIQEAVLPEEEHYAPLPEHFILFKPRDPVSGDFHWGKQEGEHFYLAAIDCTGHGVPGGFMSMLGISFLNEIMANASGLRPGELLSRLKERVVAELTGGKENGTKDGMDAALLRLGPEEKDGLREVEFAGAQNPLYLIRPGVAQDMPEFEVRRGGEKVDESPWKAFRDTPDGLEIKGDKGGIGRDASGIEAFRTVRFKAHKEDELFIFSDGYADQFGGEKGKKFRYGAFKRLLVNLRGKPMGEEKELLESSFEDWKGDREQVDDVLVIGLRI